MAVGDHLTDLHVLCSGMNLPMVAATPMSALLLGVLAVLPTATLLSHVYALDRTPLMNTRLINPMIAPGSSRLWMLGRLIAKMRFKRLHSVMP